MEAVTLRQEIERFVTEKNAVELKKMLDLFEWVREDIFAIMDNKIDLCLPVVKERNNLNQVTSNINLVKSAMKRITSDNQ